jgi:hypothetical protein
MPQSPTSEEIKRYREKAAIYIFVGVIIFAFSLLAALLGSSAQGLLTFVAICLTAWGMGWYAVSKGYLRSIGVLLGALLWIGLVILWLMKDRYKLPSR